MYKLVNKHSNEKWTLCRCISCWKWGYSIAMSIYQRVCGFKYAKSQSCWDFSPCFSSPGPSWLESRYFKPRLRFLRHGCFSPPPPKKKKHWGRFHPSEKKKKPDYKFNTFCTRVGSKIVFSWWYIPVEFVSEKKNCRFFNLPAKTSCYECSSTLLLKPAIQLPKKNGREFLCSAGSSASRTLRNQGSAVTMPGSCMEQSRSCGDCRASSGVINRCLMNIFGSWNLLMVQEIR